MLRVPGRSGTLEELRAQGADVKVCYSIRDGLRHARENPGRETVFLSVGFETTVPAAALAAIEAARDDLRNFTLLCGHKRIMPAMSALLRDGRTAVDGFLLPGHVSVIIGSNAYEPLVSRHEKACVVAGFEPDQLLDGIARLVSQIADRSPRLENVYGVAVTPEGNAHARRLLEQVFDPADTEWRAMGTIPDSGLELKDEYARFDACRRLGLEIGPDYEPAGCRCGEVIQGRADPSDCKLFGTACTFQKPVGPCMVSSEGTCAAWYRYARVEKA
jgi:hydrogenase expression/formation protein HypD